MNIHKNFSLLHSNTFGFDQKAENFVEVDSEDALQSAIEYANEQDWNTTILGDGSNIVLTKDIPGLVLRITSQSAQYEHIDDETTHLKVAAGKNWNNLVVETVSADLPGLENLSLIPGTCGAAPIQNIGAYGVELSDHLVDVTALHLPTNNWTTLTNAECEFNYRNSIFKQKSGEFAIYSMTIRLGTINGLNTSYNALSVALDRSEKKINCKLVSDTVAKIRKAKLPDFNKIGNAGSFFKNPIISKAQRERILLRYPNAVCFSLGNGSYKLAAGWVLEKLGYKGYRKNGVGVHSEQALILVNHGGGTGAEIMKLARQLQHHAKEEFGVELEIEPVLF